MHSFVWCCIVLHVWRNQYDGDEGHRFHTLSTIGKWKCQWWPPFEGSECFDADIMASLDMPIWWIWCQILCHSHQTLILTSTGRRKKKKLILTPTKGKKLYSFSQLGCILTSPRKMEKEHDFKNEKKWRKEKR